MKQTKIPAVVASILTFAVIGLVGIAFAGSNVIAQTNMQADGD